MSMPPANHLGGARWRRMIFSALAALMAPSHAAQTFSEDSVKAAYLFRFTQYIEWPQPSAAGEPFTIAVLGAPGVARELQRLLPTHPIKAAAARVRPISNVQELGDAQMLYIGPQAIGRLRSAISSIASGSVLVVTDNEDGLDAGGILNFVIIDHRVRFEISLVAAERSKFRVSAELLGVAARVRGAALPGEGAPNQARKESNE